MTHEQFVNEFNTLFNTITSNDPLFNDLPSNLTLTQLKQLLSYEHGESFKIFIKRADEKIYEVLIKPDSTLKELKQSLKQQKFPNQIISWKYIWKNYCLCFDDEKLMDDNKTLRDYGLFNKCELYFLKLIRN